MRLGCILTLYDFKKVVGIHTTEGVGYISLDARIGGKRPSINAFHSSITDNLDPVVLPAASLVIPPITLAASGIATPTTIPFALPSIIV